MFFCIISRFIYLFQYPLSTFEEKNFNLVNKILIFTILLFFSL